MNKYTPMQNVYRYLGFTVFWIGFVVGIINLIKLI